MFWTSWLLCSFSFSCVTFYFFNSLYWNDKENIFFISLRKAYYTFLTGCVGFNCHFIKWHSKLWRAPGALFLPPSFSDSLVHLRRALATCCVFPLGVYILFSASPPPPGENISPSKGRWKFSLSSEVNPYAFWLLMMGSGVAACDHLTLLTSHLPVPFLCQRKWFFFFVLLALHCCIWLNFFFLKSWRFLILYLGSLDLSNFLESPYQRNRSLEITSETGRGKLPHLSFL